MRQHSSLNPLNATPGALRLFGRPVFTEWLGITLLLSLSVSPATAQRWNCINIQQVSFEDCLVLQKLYEDTGGLEWFADAGWLRSIQPCAWYGITCLSTAWPRPIIRIDLSDNNLTGALPGELSLLVDLRELNLDNSGPGLRKRRLTGNLSATIGALPRLEVLVLSNHSFTGTIPSELGNLTHVRILKLEGNRFTGPIPDQLTNLTSLEQLSLGGNRLAGGIPAGLGTLTSLRQLDLSDNLLDGPIPAELGNLLELEGLDLGNNKLTGKVPPELASLENLNWMSLANNMLAGPLSLSVASLGRSLTYCQMSGNDLCTPSTPPFDVLGPSSICGIEPTASCSVCDAPELVPGAQCQALEALYQATTGPQWEVSDDWMASHAPCQWPGVTCEAGTVSALELPANGLEGKIPPEISLLHDLTLLDLSSNTLSGDLPESIGELTNLSHMDLSNNSLESAVPLPVAALGVGLGYCDLRNNSALCLPGTPPYRALQSDLICGLPLQNACSPQSRAQVTNLQATAGVGTSVTVTWDIETDVDGIVFYMEKWAGQGFEEVAEIPSTGVAEYSFIQENLSAGVHRFRLRLSYADGHVEWTTEVSAELLEEGLHVNAPYPNPFQHSTNIDFATGTAQSVRVVMFDAEGREVRTLFARPMRAHERVSVQISAKDLASGPYFLVFTNESRILHRSRVLLTR